MSLFHIKPKIYYGSDSLDILRTLEMKKVFIVTDKTMVKLGVINNITDILKERNVEIAVYSDVNPDPKDEEIIKGMLDFVSFDPDCVIALGGGSPIDACKGILYFVKKIKRAMNETEKLTFIAVPTTSGTGSEVTTYSVVTSGNKKIPLSDVEMLPDIAILNPVFTETLPPAVIGDTGMDVLTHAIEAYVSANPNLFSRTLAIGAIRTVFSDLVKNYENPSLEKERTNMQIASCMAGVAFSTSSLGINHSVAHSVGALFHKPHGRLNAVLMPKIIAFNAKNPAARKAYCEIARALDFIPKTEQEGVEILIKGIEMRNAKMGIPKRLRDLGIPKDEYFKQIDKIISDIENDMCTEYNPRKFSYAEIKELLEEVY